MDSTLKKRKVKEDIQIEKQRGLSESRLTAPTMQQKYVTDGDSASRKAFLPVVALSQIVGVSCLVLVFYWAKNVFRGFAWSSNAELQFNYHPVMMVFGLIFLYGDAILVYRVFAFLPKYPLKLLHGALHVSALVMAAVGLAAVFENHRRTNRADLWSLHSWVGLATYILFCLQYVSGLVTFLLPITPMKYRSQIMPFHQFFGVGVFIMAIASALMGINEKLAFIPDYVNGKTIVAGTIGNSLGILIVVFGFLVVFLTTHSVYKRKHLPNEVPAPVN